MLYSRLKVICVMLNEKFKGKPLPKTDWVVKDFIIMPNEERDPEMFDKVVTAIVMDVPIDEIEATVKDLSDLEIRLRFADAEMNGFYYPHHFAFAHDDLSIFPKNL